MSKSFTQEIQKQGYKGLLNKAPVQQNQPEPKAEPPKPLETPSTETNPPIDQQAAVTKPDTNGKKEYIRADLTKSEKIRIDIYCAQKGISNKDLILAAVEVYMKKNPV